LHATFQNIEICLNTAKSQVWKQYQTLQIDVNVKVGTQL